MCRVLRELFLWACVYVFRQHVLPCELQLWVLKTQTDSRMWNESEKDAQQSKQCAHQDDDSLQRTHGALQRRTRSRLCSVAHSLRVMELCSQSILGVNKNLISSSKHQKNLKQGGGPASDLSVPLLDWYPASCWPSGSYHPSECGKEAHLNNPNNICASLITSSVTFI